MKYRSVIIAIATALSISALTRIESAAQTVISGSMFGRTSYRLKAEEADSTNNEPISFASIYMRHIKDTVITNFSLTGPDGKCEVNDVTRGDYDIFVEFMGYSKYHKQLYISKDIDLGKILLKPDLEALKAARVSANVNAMEIRKDTIIYNAAAFRTMPTDKLKDLLKQMPGVEVDGSGNVKVNGKTVSQITLNGKTFFLGDKTAALNNLPASVVNKVKVVDKESETAEFTGIKDDKKKTVMDVELKETVTDVKLQLRDVYHNLLELDRQIISFLNLIEYQNRLYEKVQKLKYLRDQMLLETNTDIKAKMEARNPVWMEARPRYTLKVSLSMLRTTDLGLKILQQIAKGKGNDRLRKGNLAEPLTEDELTEQQQVMQMVDVGEVKNAFMASGDNLFHFVMNFSGYRKPMTEEEKLVVFCQIAAQYFDELSISEAYSQYGDIEYPLISPETA